MVTAHPGLQRRHRHPRARARAPVRLGLLQAAGPEQADARAVGGRSRPAWWPRASGRWRSTAATTRSTRSRRRATRSRSSIPKEGVPLVVSPTAIMTFAPHPNAAKLFTDFSFTREIQQVMADSEGLYTGHPEVKYPADKPKLTDLKLLHRRSRGAGEAERGDQEALRGVLRRVSGVAVPSPRRRASRAVDRALPVWVGGGAGAGLAHGAAAGLAGLDQRERRAAAPRSRTIARVLGDPALRKALWNTVVLAFWVGLASVAVGAPLAWLTARTDVPGAGPDPHAGAGLLRDAAVPGRLRVGDAGRAQRGAAQPALARRHRRRGRRCSTSSACRG